MQLGDSENKTMKFDAKNSNKYTYTYRVAINLWKATYLYIWQSQSGIKTMEREFQLAYESDLYVIG